jgi:hypothetical protein
MKTLKVLLFVCLLLLSDGLFAAPYDMIPVGDPVLDDLRYLSLESGNSFLSFTAPLAPHEIELFLDRIDVSLLSEPAKEAYYRIKDRLEPETPLSLTWENFSFFFNINSTLEARIRSDTEIAWYPMYPKIPSLLSVPIRFFFADILQLYIEPSITVTPKHYSATGIFGMNIPTGYEDFNATQPFRAFIAAGDTWWNFQIGRDRLFWGTGNTGSLSFSDNSAYFEFMRLSLFSPFFKYSLLVSQMPLMITNELYADANLDDASILWQTTQRHFYMHRIDFNFFDKLSLGIMEGVMVGNSPLEIRFLSPLMIFHSLFSWNDYTSWIFGSEEGYESMIGSYFSIEINWNIVKSLAVYGQFVMNQVALPVETGPDEPPNALGYLAGLQFSRFIGDWGSIFFLEFIYTDPYLHLNSSPFASHIQMHRLADGKNYYYYIGYPRDTIALTLGARFFSQDTLSFTGEFSWVSKGQHNKNSLVWDWNRGSSAFDERTPSGIVENNFIATLSAKWKPLPYLSLNASLTGFFIFDNKHIAGSNTLGGQATLAIVFQF